MTNQTIKDSFHFDWKDHESLKRAGTKNKERTGVTCGRRHVGEGCQKMY